MRSTSPVIMPKHHGLQDDAAYPADFDLIRSWLSSCLKHPVCSRLPVFGRKGFLPTRLIEIDAVGGSKAPKLVDSSAVNNSLDLRYVALSHCWGNPGKVPKTFESTLSEHQLAILGILAFN